MKETINISGTKHNIGDANCPACYGKTLKHSYCGGLMHSELLETGNSFTYVRKVCDKCKKNIYFFHEFVTMAGDTND